MQQIGFSYVFPLGNGSRAGTWLKPVKLGLGLTFVLKKWESSVFTNQNRLDCAAGTNNP